MELPKRRAMRLKNYDYSLCGAYFITFCTNERLKTLGDIRRDTPGGCPCVSLAEFGKIAVKQIEFIEKRYDIVFDKYIIMPNHIHVIIMINNPAGSGHPQGVSLPQIVGGYKSRISCEYLKMQKERGMVMGKIWQSRYYDRIIRDEPEYQRIWEYIDTNPLHWEEDRFYIK